MLLLIDNYDSFTYNLYQYFCELGAEVLVKRNDELQLADIERLAPQHLVISRPCTPNEAGISLAAIRHFAGKLPILGVCWAPGAGAGVRRRGGARPRGDARQNLGDSSPGRRRVSWPERSADRDPLSLAGAESRYAAGLF